MKLNFGCVFSFIFNSLFVVPEVLWLLGCVVFHYGNVCLIITIEELCFYLLMSCNIVLLITSTLSPNASIINMGSSASANKGVHPSDDL